MDKIFDIIESALTKAGYVVMDGDHETVIIRSKEEDKDFEIRITEIGG